MSREINDTTQAAHSALAAHCTGSNAFIRFISAFYPTISHTAVQHLIPFVSYPQSVAKLAQINLRVLQGH